MRTYSIYAMLAEAEPVFPEIKDRKYAHVARYPEVLFREALEDFLLQRAILLRALQGINPEDWERGGIIQNRRYTVFTQARRMVKHEAGHLEQLSALER